MGKITNLTPSELDFHNNINWLLWRSTTGWWLKKKKDMSQHQRRFNIIIAAVWETRLPSTDNLRNQEYPLLSSEAPPPSKSLTARFLWLRLLLAQCPSWVFMPLHLAVQLIPWMSFMRSLRLPSERSHLRDIYTYALISPPELDWPKILVQHHWPLGVGRIIYIGQSLLKLCSYYVLGITNTFFSDQVATKDILELSKITSPEPTELGLLPRQTAFSSPSVTIPYTVLTVKRTKHSLVGTNVRFQPRSIHRSKQKGRLLTQPL